jgi:hypothetical protein
MNVSIGRKIAGLAVAAGSVVGAAAISAQPASAWAWSGSVTLQGTSWCGAGNNSTWVWVSASNGEQGWATNGTGRYKFDFKNIPTSGTTVTVTYGNRGFNCKDTFGVQRPTVGTSATRNLSKIWPNA